MTFDHLTPKCYDWKMWDNACSEDVAIQFYYMTINIIDSDWTNTTSLSFLKCDYCRLKCMQCKHNIFTITPKIVTGKFQVAKMHYLIGRFLRNLFCYPISVFLSNAFEPYRRRCRVFSIHHTLCSQSCLHSINMCTRHC